MPPPYTFDSSLRIWTTLSHADFAYSDGASVEQRLLAQIRQCTDISSASMELRAHIVDWPSEYHLSPVRHNLLRPFSFGPADRILELGCGCGSMTRHLGESGATVVALEGSKTRATIAAERCRDLPNVGIYCDNIAAFETQERFDVVTLIGVLEYSRLFIEGADPIQACIDKAKSFLKDEGTLIIAIENQLGLKYFNGCAEDHLDLPYSGINELYDKGTAVTFGRSELQSRLQRAGLAHVDFFYPFPDYKVPEVIFSEAAFDCDTFRPADMLQNQSSRDYGSRQYRAFHEHLAWHPIQRNRLMPDLSNSFLVLASWSHPVLFKGGWLARAFSAARNAGCSTETVFRHHEDAIAVEKRRLYPGAELPMPADGLRFHHHPVPSSRYVSGRLYVTALQSLMARGAGPEEVLRWCSPWLGHLVSRATGPSGALELPADMLDAIPANLVQHADGTLADIDSEWRADAPIPLFWVAARGIAMSLRGCAASPAMADILLGDLVGRALAPFGQKTTQAEYRLANEYENALQLAAFGALRNPVSLFDMLTGPVGAITAPPRAHETLVQLQDQLSRAQAEIARIKRGLSWRITKPIRGAAYVWDKVTGKLKTAKQAR